MLALACAAARTDASSNAPSFKPSSGPPPDLNSCSCRLFVLSLKLSSICLICAFCASVSSSSRARGPSGPPGPRRPGPPCCGGPPKPPGPPCCANPTTVINRAAATANAPPMNFVFADLISLSSRQKIPEKPCALSPCRPLSSLPSQFLYSKLPGGDVKSPSTPCKVLSTGADTSLQTRGRSAG